jgi:hypothetical protein
MRDIETIDSELRLLLAIRQMVREEEGRTPSTAHIDELLNERLKLPVQHLFRRTTESQRGDHRRKPRPMTPERLPRRALSLACCQPHCQ